MGCRWQHHDLPGEAGVRGWDRSGSSDASFSQLQHPPLILLGVASDWVDKPQHRFPVRRQHQPGGSARSKLHEKTRHWGSRRFIVLCAD